MATLKNFTTQKCIAQTEKSDNENTQHLFSIFVSPQCDKRKKVINEILNYY